MPLSNLVASPHQRDSWPAAVTLEAKISPRPRPSTAYARSHRIYVPEPPPPQEASTLTYKSPANAAALLRQFAAMRQRAAATAARVAGTSPAGGAPGVRGAGCQNTQRESWEEQHAWNGFLATQLDGAVQRIHQLGEEARAKDKAYGELSAVAEQFKYKASNKNVDKLERRAASLEEALKASREEYALLRQRLHRGEEVPLGAEEAKRAMNALRGVDEMLNDSDDADGAADSTAWSLETWVGSLDLQQVVARALATSIRGQLRSRGMEPDEHPQGKLEKRFLQELYLQGGTGAREALVAMLLQGSMLGGLCETMWEGMSDLVPPEE